MALAQLKIYQDVVNPENLQLYAQDSQGQPYVKSLSQAEYSQLKNLGIQEDRVNNTFFQGTQLGSLYELKGLATTLDQHDKAFGYKYADLLRNADFSQLATTGGTFITAEQAAEYKKTSYGGAEGLNAAMAAQPQTANTLQDLINVSPEFLKTFSGERIQYGNKIYGISASGIQEWTAPTSVNRDNMGLQPTQTLQMPTNDNPYPTLMTPGQSSIGIKEGMKWFKPEWQQFASAGNYGQGPSAQQISTMTPQQQEYQRLLGTGMDPAQARNQSLAATPTPTSALKELPFPTNQDQMKDYLKKKDSGEYVFQNGKWYSTTGGTTTGGTTAGGGQQTITIPKGATLTALAKQYGTTIDAILKANPKIKNPDLIYAGDTLVIPGSSTTGSGTTGSGTQNIGNDLGIGGSDDILTDSSEVRSTEGSEEKDQEQQELDDIADKQKLIENLTLDKQIEALKKELGLNTGKPETPTFESDYDALRSEHGISAIETQINAIDKQMRDMEASLRQGLYNVEGELKPMELIGTEQRELQRMAQEKFDTLNRSRQTLVDEYNTKTAIINNIMNLKQMDYNAAMDAYQTEFSSQIKLLEILENRKTKEENALNQQKDDAKANLNTIINMMSDSGKTWKDIDSSMRSQILKLETKAGLPLGTMEAFKSNNPNAKLLGSKEGYDANGNAIVTFIYADKDGMPGTIKVVKTGGTKDSEPTSVPDWFRADIEKEFKAKGQSPAEWVVQSRWQEELNKKKKDEWKGKTTSTNIADLPEEQQIFINKIQSEIKSGTLFYSEAVDTFPAIAKWLKP